MAGIYYVDTSYIFDYEPGLILAEHRLHTYIETMIEAAKGLAYVETLLYFWQCPNQYHRTT